jgi:hypothetical protein
MQNAGGGFTRIADIVVEQRGSFFILRAESMHGLLWLRARQEAAPWGRGLVVESRDVFSVVIAALCDGLHVGRAPVSTAPDALPYDALCESLYADEGGES